MLWIEMKAATDGQATASASKTSAASSRVRPAAAHVLGHIHGGEAEAAGLGQNVARDARLVSQARACGRDPVPAEVAGHVADRRLLVGEGEVHQLLGFRRGLTALRAQPVVLGPRDQHDGVAAVGDLLRAFAEREPEEALELLLGVGDLPHRRLPAGGYSIVGIEKAAPSLMPDGQRAVTVLVRV